MIVNIIVGGNVNIQHSCAVEMLLWSSIGFRKVPHFYCFLSLSLFYLLLLYFIAFFTVLLFEKIA